MTNNKINTNNVVVLGSIELDNADNTRANIILDGGRLFCDGNDITPRVDGYDDIESALSDCCDMYHGWVWGWEPNEELV